ncbi:MAG TPA: 2-oxoacid:acceptor oxidoreductase subunit alpha [Gemmataceae bacterium]|nr:2-oxoacid:acceptor oxidoreductase subunit alpha [Gemmataceae bacterium]
MSLLEKPLVELADATVGFCGDSGDGMQLVGTEFANTSANLGNDISTFPDFPAEIRAPAGTLAGVSGYQIQFSSSDIYTPGDRLNALVAMNPAALKLRLKDLEPGGILIVNKDSFAEQDLKKANYKTNPLEDGTVNDYRVIAVNMTSLNRAAVAEAKLTTRESDRCKNFFALGIIYWLYERSLEPTEKWIKQKFAKKEAIQKANLAALKAGYNYGETCELMPVHFRVPKAKLPPGTYRRITGNEALALGLVTAAKQADKHLVYAGYPITPASDILHYLAALKHYNVYTVQAEDEIAAMAMAIGASFGGQLAVTATSGPGICLKSEGINLAVMTELPVVIVDVQRGGPSTGLPTKTEQADLLQALFGRNGESPVAVVAPRSPADCFDMAVEACRLAFRFMTPIFILSDGFIANSSEPWRLPDLAALPDLRVKHPTAFNSNGNGEAKYLPYKRDERLVRPWAVPGTPDLEHRLGGIEKQDVTGNISYDPANHEHMVRTRAKKIANIAQEIPLQEVEGPPEGDLLVVGWGGTYGSILTAVQRAQREGMKVAHAHLRYLNPFPRNLGELMKKYKKVLVAELNGGQLCLILRATFMVDAISYSKVQGQPFLVSELQTKMNQVVKK